MTGCRQIIGNCGGGRFATKLLRSVRKSSKTSKMTASKTLWAKFNVEKQEFLLKMVILTIAAILGEFHNIQPAFLKINNNSI